MRLATYQYAERELWGIITDDNMVLDCSSVAPSLKTAIEQNKLSTLNPSPVGVALSEVTLLPPIRQPEKIICIGVNYANRNAEYKDNTSEANYPSVFMRTPDSLTGHNRPLIRPPESHQLDYEGEIVIVIGKDGRRIRQEDAYQHIAGLTIMNEGTLRDWVRHAKFNVTQGKNFVHSGSIGPWLVTADQFNEQFYENMTVTTRVNGEVRQHDTTANMMFPFAYIIHYLSKFYLLKPGDIIATGTPNGAGARFDPPRYLVPGDIVEVEVQGIGTLRNGIEDEII